VVKAMVPDPKRRMSKYVAFSVESIDSHLQKGDYKKAFAMLILVLGRVDENGKNEIIRTYSTDPRIFSFVSDSV
jgi:hypothetical protein